MDHLAMKETSIITNKYNDSITRLPESSLIEILCKLPTKTIFQLKCISKQWLFLISTPDFAKIYISKVSKPPKTAFFLRTLENPKPQLSNTKSEEIVGVKVENFGHENLFSTLMVNGFHPKPEEIDGFCDGLLLCCDASKLYYCIYNVITEEIVQVKPSPNRGNCSPNVPCGLICNLGSGSVNLYCLVEIQSVVDDLVDVLNFHVYFSECNEWKIVKVSCPRQLDKVFDRHPLSQAITYKGMLHWVNVVDGYILAYDPLGDPNRCRFIDLPGENFKGNMLPLENMLHMFYRVCNVSDGSLRYFEMDDKFIRGETFPKCRVWMLNDYEKGEWVLEHHILQGVYFADGCIERDISLKPNICFVLTPLSFHPLNKDVVYFRSPLGIVSYNVQTKRLAMEVKMENRIGQVISMDVFPIVFPYWPLGITKPLQHAP